MVIEMKITSSKESINTTKPVKKLGFCNRNSNKDGYNCKTCGKVFSTHQALGGHQGIHRKIIKLSQSDEEDALMQLTLAVGGGYSRKFSSLRLHKCKLCKKEFKTGQALGGHMTRHRDEKESDKMVEKGSDLTVELWKPSAEKVEQEKVRRDLVSAAKSFRLWLV